MKAKAKLIFKKPQAPTDEPRAKPLFSHRLKSTHVCRMDNPDSDGSKTVRFVVAEQLARAGGKRNGPRIEALKTTKGAFVLWDEQPEVRAVYTVFPTLDALKKALYLHHPREQALFEGLGGSIEEALPEI